MNGVPPLPTVLAATAVTLTVFLACRRLYLALRHPLLHPVFCSVLVLTALVAVSEHPAAAFARETQPLTWLLGPAVVAMAVPVWERRALVGANWRMLAVAVGVSLLLAVSVSLLLRPWLGSELARALSTRSVTVPVALGIAQEAELRPDLVVVSVMAAGMFGLAAGPLLLALCGVRGDRAELGVALGCAAHGLGTARALEAGPVAGAFASACMGLSALVYGFVLPLVLRLL